MSIKDNSTSATQIATGTTAQRPGSPVNGQIRYNTTTGYGEIYNATAGQWLLFGTSPTLDVEYLVVAGGGGGGWGDSGNGMGGGGAGGSTGPGSGQTSSGVNGTTNTGGGGGGAGYTAPLGGNGGSGIVILRYLTTYTGNFSAGLTVSTATSGSYKISTITAGTGTVTFTIA